MNIQQQLHTIGAADEAARRQARCLWDQVAKPLGSLGLLEAAVEKIAALTGNARYSIDSRTLFVLCADNGVVAQGVSQTGSEVTAAVARAFAAGRSNACQMARCARCQVLAVDMGIKDFSPIPGVLNRRIGNGTADITQGPAMRQEQLMQALQTGIQLVQQEAAQGTKLLLTGEMGIGNTTTASAVLAVLTGCPPGQVTGKGAGLSAAGYQRKLAAIERAIAVNQPNPADALDVLRKLGGFDIAGLTGVFLGAALYKIPVLIDGLISAVAALCAVRICPAAEKALLASHLSAEPGGQIALQALGLPALIQAGLRLGEGTGALCALPILDMAYAVYQGSTFDDLHIEQYVPQ